jgi:tetratricopeptide (TPR) repeat protein
VFDNIEGARHLPFFAALAQLEDDDANWRSISAGLVVLRLVDSWIEEGAASVAADGWGIRSVEATIEEMPAGVPARAVLRSVVDAVQTSSPSDMNAIAPRLMAYARSLDLDAKWALSADVYQTVIAHVHPIEESDVAITAHIRLAFSLRELGEIDRSAAAYDDASVLAQSVGDVVGVLRAQIGRARIAVTRGNLPDAERRLDDAITRAATEGLPEVRAVALQERANVAHLRGHYDSAVRLAYEALGDTQDPINRDRLLLDIAGSFYMLGARSVARDAYLILEATAQEQYQRWVAAINLMELAAAEGATTIFERYRRQLLEQPLMPVLETQLHLHVGAGYAELGEPLAARAALKTACALAERYQLNRLLFAAEQRLSSISEHVPTRTPEHPLDAPDLRAIARELRARGRELASR